MGLQVSVASLLLSVVVAAPCMRKVTCLPPEKKPPTTHVLPQPAPQAIASPAATAPVKPLKTRHCTVRTQVARRTACLAEHTS